MRVTEKYKLSGKYLKASHLTDGPIRVIISYVDEDVPMGTEGERKDVVHFEETGIRPLVLNKTNAETLAQLFGDDSNGWPGGAIELYVWIQTQAQASGSVGRCVDRQRPPKPIRHLTQKRSWLSSLTSSEEISAMRRVIAFAWRAYLP